MTGAIWSAVSVGCVSSESGGQVNCPVKAAEVPTTPTHVPCDKQEGAASYMAQNIYQTCPFCPTNQRKLRFSSIICRNSGFSFQAVSEIDKLDPFFLTHTAWKLTAAVDGLIIFSAISKVDPSALILVLVATASADVWPIVWRTGVQILGETKSIETNFGFSKPNKVVRLCNLNEIAELLQIRLFHWSKKPC